MDLIAHRGNNGNEFKENSKEAFINCFATSYISGVEMDVRLTRDLVVVISHSDVVDGKVISKCKYNKLKNKVNKLDDVLSSLSSKKKIVIDIKGDDKRIVDSLYSVLNNYDYQFYICSFNYNIVSLFKSRFCNYKVGLIIGYMLNIDRLHNKFDFNSLHYNLVNRAHMSKEIFIWTVNDMKDFKKIKKYGSDFYIITDKAYLFYD